MIQKIKKLKEEAPTNSMGASSSVPGSGAIDTYNPVLFKHDDMIKRFMNVWKQAKNVKENDRRHRSL